MKMSIILAIMTILCLMAPKLETLITFGAMMLSLALLSTILIAKLINSWFALILFLIYITGLLVMFGYMMAMSPNTKHNKGYFKNLMLILVTSITLKLSSVIQLPKSNTNFEWEVISMIKDYNCTIYWLMAMILLIALIMVVSICFKTPTPLRPYLK